jgi:hypothetical protein
VIGSPITRIREAASPLLFSPPSSSWSPAASWARRKTSGATARPPREKRASRLVSQYVGEPVECKDNGAVNVELHPEYEQGFSCYNEAGEFRNAMVSPDGQLLSVTRAARLKPAEDS